jgi:uncharacterized protein
MGSNLGREPGIAPRRPSRRRSGNPKVLMLRDLIRHRQTRATPHAVKLHLDRFDGLNAFSGYGEGYVLVNQRRHTRSLVVLPDRLIDPWAPNSAAEVAEESFAQIEPLPLEILLVGTGARMHLLHPRLTARLAARRIGVEVMDTRAACRTYNILLAEGRKVAAALVVEPGSA